MEFGIPLWQRAALLVLTGCAVLGQSPERPRFDVTSVKVSSANCCTAYGTGNGKGYGRYVTLKMMIGLPWQVQQFQISGGPGWIGADRFEIAGKSEDTKADYPKLRLMVQSLLEDRFQLKIHRETRESSVYALVAAKGGPKVKLSSDETSPDVNGGPATPNDGPVRGSLLAGPGMLIANAVSLSRFARFLAPSLDRPVIDKTNLAGRFDIRLQWTPDTLDPDGTTPAPTGSADARQFFPPSRNNSG